MKMSRWSTILVASLSLGSAPTQAAPGDVLPPDPIVPVRVATGFSSLEGPAWVADASESGGYLVFSNQNSPFALHKYVPGTGTSVLRSYTNKVNGNAVDADGNLITCESGNRRLVRITPTGTASVLVSQNPDGTSMNEPNDVVVKSDGTIWFTTPSWTASELARQYVLRLDPGRPLEDPERYVVVVSGVDKPNGLGFSPDESIFYLNDNGANKVRRYTVNEDNSLTELTPLVEGLDRWPDGMAVDPYGNVFVALFGGSGKGINIYSPAGQLLKRIPFPESANVTNCAWGGADRRTLYVTAASDLYAIEFPPLLPDPDPPAAPAEFRLVYSDEGDAVFSWEMMEEVDGFLLEEGMGEVFAEVPAAGGLIAESTVTLSGLGGGWRAFRVRAVGLGGLSEPSEVVYSDPGSALFSRTQEANDGFRTADWIGPVFLGAYPWALHLEHGWWYTMPMPDFGFWAYDFGPGLGWLYTGYGFYPYFVHAATASILLYFGPMENEEGEPERLFYRYDSSLPEGGEWLLIPAFI